MPRTCIYLLTTVCLIPTMLLSTHAEDGNSQTIQLFNGQDLTGWEHFLVDANTKRDAVWSVEDGVLVCQGKPGGYLCTQKKYTNFRLAVEWRWPEKPGNSGVLMRITGKPTMLPNCVEAQLASGSAGDMYGFQGFKIDGDKARRFDNPNVAGGLAGLKKMSGNEKPAGEWNKYEITAQGGTITVKVNGKLLNEATGCDVRAGQIGLQSEGGVIHFRNITLVPLKDE